MGKPVKVEPVASRCLGCAPVILVGIVSHSCGGNRIPAEELGWYCNCPEPECRRRQRGEWTAEKKPSKRQPAAARGR